MMASRDQSSDVLSAEVHEVISAPEINHTNGLWEILGILAKAVIGGLLTYLITTFSRIQDSRIPGHQKNCCTSLFSNKLLVMTFIYRLTCGHLESTCYSSTSIFNKLPPAHPGPKKPTV